MSDIKTAIDNAENRIQTVAKDAASKEQELKDLGPKIAAMIAEYERVEAMQAGVNERVKKVEGDVDQIKKAIEIVGRGFTPSEFKEYVAKLQFSSWRPEFIVLHSTQTPTLAQWKQIPGEQRLQNLAIYYGDMRGFGGGPHLFIDDKKIWVFNPLTKPGVHVPSWNRISIGIEMVGDYDSEPLDESVRDNTIQAIAILDAALNLKSDALRFHSDDPATTHKNCPGKNVDKIDLVRRIDLARLGREK